jgi:hypothetical protein
MCRKHYQRIRYRTGADFSVTQIGMVYEQIVRMIFWSRGLENPNRTNQEGIAIRSWTFSIRRREVKRMADTNGRDLIPRWIMQSLGEGKTHDEILDVVERLHHEIQQGTLKEVRRLLMLSQTHLRNFRLNFQLEVKFLLPPILDVLWTPGMQLSPRSHLSKNHRPLNQCRRKGT